MKSPMTSGKPQRNKRFMGLDLVGSLLYYEINFNHGEAFEYKIGAVNYERSMRRIKLAGFVSKQQASSMLN